MLVINSPFVWTKEPLKSQGSRNEESKEEFLCAVPLTRKGDHEYYSTGSHCILDKRSKPGCLGSCQQQGSRDRTVLLGSALRGARSRARPRQGEAHTNTQGRFTGEPIQGQHQDRYQDDCIFYFKHLRQRFSNCDPISAVSASAGNFLEMQIHRPHPRSTESETLGVRPAEV